MRSSKTVIVLTHSHKQAMFFGKLLPREGNFFEMFNQHADRIVEAAHAFAKLVENYADPHLRDKYNQEVDNAERAADRVTHEVNKAIHITFGQCRQLRSHCGWL